MGRKTRCFPVQGCLDPFFYNPKEMNSHNQQEDYNGAQAESAEGK
jgi:hypothetical protein